VSRRRPARLSRQTPQAPLLPAETADQLERLRLEKLLTDWVTGLTLHPLADLRNERIADLGIIYLQLGRLTGVESFYGWQLYDRLLRLVTESLRESLEGSRLKSHFFSLQFTGSDGFYLLFDLSDRRNGLHAVRLEQEAERFREGVIRKIRKTLGQTIVDLMSVHASCLIVPDDPRVRPSRNLIRGLREAARIVESHEMSRQAEFVSRGKQIISGRKLHAVYQPVFNVRDRSVLGYEALIRGPAGSPLEYPDLLFAAARECDMQLELENLCLETIFGNLPRAVQNKKLFVNASSKLLTHSLFLDERNLTQIRESHPEVVIEISEKEIVRDYPSFRDVLDRLRAAGISIAMDDAGSGYSGLESILQLRPEYIKVANTIVHDLHLDSIKREVITALASLGRQIKASLVAEGIERAEEIDSLLELGVDYGQGYFLARPSNRIPARSPTSSSR
jgi:EAL domain-containing protein (putative c-di-GMP-specific phosphodiesterase class I)